jgi:hypothetical protein
MIRGQSAIGQKQNPIDGRTAVGVKSLAKFIRPRRTGLVANRFRRRKKESPIVELVIPLIALGRQILASFRKKQRR